MDRDPGGIRQLTVICGELKTVRSRDGESRGSREAGGIREGHASRATQNRPPRRYRAGRIGMPGSLGEAEIRTLQEMGHAIGSHGWDHVDWTGLDAAGRTREIDEAKARLSEICGRPIEAASIPFGRYNAGVLKVLRQASFTTAYSSDGGAVRGRPFPMPRTSLTGNMTRADLEAIIEGRESLKRRLRRAVTTRLKRVI